MYVTTATPNHENRNKKYPNIKETSISVNDIIKLLQGLKSNKAKDPDRNCSLLLQQLSLEIAPIFEDFYFEDAYYIFSFSAGVRFQLRVMINT